VVAKISVMQDALSQLGSEPYVSLVTFRRDGREVATPVWIAPLADRLYVFTERSAGKVKRLKNDGRVRLAPCNVRGIVSGDWTGGRARLVDDEAREAEIYAAFDRKYGWQMRLVNFGSRLAGRIGGRAVLEIELGEFDE
jgi:PPOX class probable F420-dependent enzyme